MKDRTTFAITRRVALRRAGLIVALPILGLAVPARAETPSGRLEMDEVEISLLFSAGWGHGTLFYDGTHRFKLKGLGVGGVGVSKLEANGNVFRLTKLSDFAGVYSEARTGAVAGDTQLQGGLWMENTAGVQIHLVPRRSGVALSLGADGVLISFDT
jgi:hypothetical protein